MFFVALPSSSARPASSTPDSATLLSPSNIKTTRRGASWLLALILVILMALNVARGSQEVQQAIPLSFVVRTLARHIPFFAARVAAPAPAESYKEEIVWNTRLPRAVCGALVGMSLAMAGVAFQSLLRNPLADPYMVGVSSGAALGSVTVILMGATGALGGMAQPLAAFATGLLATIVVYLLARRGGRLSAQTFLLAGLVVGTFFWSLIQLVEYYITVHHQSGSAASVAETLLYLLGSLSAVSWHHVAMLVPFTLLGGVMLLASWPELNIMTTGEESALHLGVDVERFKRRVILAGSLVTAATVSVAGIIAFVGFVVPHIARRLVGPDHRRLLPAAMLLGGIVLVASDFISRVYLGEMPIGVITSLAGAPVFCFLLRRNFLARTA